MNFFWSLVLLFHIGFNGHNIMKVNENILEENDSTDEAGLAKISVFPIASTEVSSDENLVVRGHKSGYIVGGEITVIEKWPFIVSIQYDGEHNCGGSLILENWVLTAAHCIQYYRSDAFAILAGETDIAKKEHSNVSQLISVTYVIYHEDFNPSTMENDIGLMMTKSAFELTDTVNLIPYATLEINHNLEAIELSDNCIVIGWGYDHVMRYPSKEKPLRVVNLPLITLKECRRLARGFDILHNNKIICAMYAGGGKDACMGDSGGPLIWESSEQYVLQGLVSYGHGCARKNVPAVYTRVDAYTGWIIDHMKASNMRTSNSQQVASLLIVLCLTIRYLQ